MSASDLLSTFVLYNQAIYPLQLLLLLVAAMVVLVAARGGAWSARIAWTGLALLWAWTGAVFFIIFYGRIGPMPQAFGVAFLLQAVAFAIGAVRRDGVALAVRRDATGIIAAFLAAYALLGYPLLADALGQHYPAQPTFGAPCPVTIFTLGVLLVFTGRVPIYQLVVPVAWGLVGVVPVVRFGILEDVMLPVAALAILLLVPAHNRRVAAAVPTAPVGETPAPMEGTGRLQ